MKRIFYITLLLAPLSVFGQGFSFQSSDTLDKTYDSGDFVSEYIMVQNDGDASITLNFVVLSNTIESKGWAMTLCTNRYCYPSVPTSGSLGTIGAKKQGFFNPHVGFNDIVGVGEFIVRVYEDGKPSNADTLVFRFTAEGTSSVAQVEQPEVTLYPNPTIEVISINGLDKVSLSKIEILNTFGQVVLLADQASSTSVSINVGELPEGKYIVVVYMADGTQSISSFVKL